ncbi:MAG: hypothetical protein ABEK59_06860, partial [Halobacteria archaeon]
MKEKRLAAPLINNFPNSRYLVMGGENTRTAETTSPHSPVLTILKKTPGAVADRYILAEHAHRHYVHDAGLAP